MAIFDEPSRKPLPQPTFADVEHAGRKGLVSIIPLIGGLGAELMNLVSSPVWVRRDEWLEDLARRLHELEGTIKGFRFDELDKNEQFVSATLHATQAAMRTHHAEKREALKNAVLNVAAGTALEDHYQSFFLNLVDALSPTHLLMLRQFKSQQSVRIAESPNWLKSNVASQIAKDLLDRGLLGGGPGHHIVPDRDQLIVGRDGVYTFHAGLTLLGSEFLKFITDPTVRE